MEIQKECFDVFWYVTNELLHAKVIPVLCQAFNIQSRKFPLSKWDKRRELVRVFSPIFFKSNNNSLVEIIKLKKTSRLIVTEHVKVFPLLLFYVNTQFRYDIYLVFKKQNSGKGGGSINNDFLKENNFKQMSLRTTE